MMASARRKDGGGRVSTKSLFGAVDGEQKLRILIWTLETWRGRNGEEIKRMKRKLKGRGRRNGKDEEEMERKMSKKRVSKQSRKRLEQQSKHET